MRRLNIVLALGIVTLAVLAAQLAAAKTDVEIHAGGQDHDSGIDWDLFWSTGMPPDSTFDALRHRRGDFGSGIQPYAPFGTHPNDRGGYRIFIPRGLEYPPQYYGDPASAQQPWPYFNNNHHHHGRDYGYPIVIPYTYGYSYYGEPGLVYTAPVYPQLGYYRQPYSFPEPVVNNDNRVTNNNYYYGYPGQIQPPQPPSAPPAAPEPAVPPTGPAGFTGPVQPVKPAAPLPAVQAGRAYGQRFYDRTRLETDAGVFSCELKDGCLLGYVGNDEGYVISAAAETAFGAFALYEPGIGFSVIFREGASVLAAYPAADGKWWIEPLPYAVDFSQDVSLGMIGCQPWVTFDAPGAKRYVVSFGGRSWREVGSATKPKLR